MVMGGTLARTCLAAMAAVAIMAWPWAADAHTELVSSDPADRSRLEAVPGVVELTFSDEVSPDFSTVVVSVDGADPVDMNLSSDEPGVLAAAVPQGLRDPGRWQVDFRVTSEDGHPIQGSITFTVTGTPRPTPSTSAPATDSATADPAPSQASGPSSSGLAATGLPSPALKGVIVGCVLGVVLLVWGFSPTRRRTQDDEKP